MLQECPKIVSDRISHLDKVVRCDNTITFACRNLGVAYGFEEPPPVIGYQEFTWLLTWIQREGETTREKQTSGHLLLKQPGNELADRYKKSKS